MLRGTEAQHVFLWRCDRTLELTAVAEGHDLSAGWPLLGVPDPGGPRRPELAPVELTMLAAFHRDQQLLIHFLGPRSVAAATAGHQAGLQPVAEPDAGGLRTRANMAAAAAATAAAATV